MGCFSFICPHCKKGIKSSSFDGEECTLRILKDGKVVESMSGEYNSYGGVFINNTQREDVEHDLRESRDWSMAWGSVCDLMFNDNPQDGIAAVHAHCDDGSIPTVQSPQDPNQGWGEDDELLAATSIHS